MKLVLFDLDGTLIDSQDIIVEAMRRALTELRLPVPRRADILGIVGLSLDRAMATLLGPDISAETVQTAVTAYKAAFTVLHPDPRFAEPLFPGAAEALERLAADPDLVLGVATGKSRNGVNRILARLGWEQRFITLQSADSAPSKPDPTMILQAAREAGVTPADVYMIGDTTYDMDMARNAGAIGVGVSWGNHPVAWLRASGARWIIDHFSQLPPLILTEAGRAP